MLADARDSPQLVLTFATPKQARSFAWLAGDALAGTTVAGAAVVCELDDAAAAALQLPPRDGRLSNVVALAVADAVARERVLLAVLGHGRRCAEMMRASRERARYFRRVAQLVDAAGVVAAVRPVAPRMHRPIPRRVPVPASTVFSLDRSVAGD